MLTMACAEMHIVQNIVLPYKPSSYTYTLHGHTCCIQRDYHQCIITWAARLVHDVPSENGGVVPVANAGEVVDAVDDGADVLPVHLAGLGVLVKVDESLAVRRACVRSMPLKHITIDQKFEFRVTHTTSAVAVAI